MSVLSALEICSWRPPDKILSRLSDLSSEPGMDTQTPQVSYDVQTLYSERLVSLCLLPTHTRLPSFLQVRLGGGMPLDSHTSVMRLPSITVRGETSSEPRILGETVMTTAHQREALTSHTRHMLVHFTEVDTPCLL